MANQSKPIGKGDDECKQFIIESLKGDETHGFDVDSMYYYNGKWHVFEYLKCDSSIVSPHTSSPIYYPWNWRKFYSLYSVAKALNGVLILVNYSSRPEDEDQVKLMEVLSFDLDMVTKYLAENQKGKLKYMTFKETKMTREEFSSYLRDINKNAGMPPLPQKGSGE